MGLEQPLGHKILAKPGGTLTEFSYERMGRFLGESVSGTLGNHSAVRHMDPIFAGKAPYLALLKGSASTKLRCHHLLNFLQVWSTERQHQHHLSTC